MNRKGASRGALTLLSAAVADTTTDFSFDAAAQVAEEEGVEGQAPGLGPWQLAFRRLRRNKVALGFFALFVVIVVLCVGAPVYSNWTGHGPNENNLTGKFERHGKQEYVVSPAATSPCGCFTGAATRSSWASCRLSSPSSCR